mgnify:CR=1 FL=1
MFESRFNHAAASEAAQELARLLKVRRLRRSFLSVVAEQESRYEALKLREAALWRFSDDPYHADALLQIFHAGDRAHVLDAGRPTTPGTPTLVSRAA